MKRYFLVGLASILALSYGCLNKPTEPAPKTGTISGRVTDKSTNDPISNASVSTNPTTSSKLTDNSGSYTIEDVEPGPYVVTATESGHKSSTVGIKVEAGKTATADIQLVSLGPELLFSTNSLNFGTVDTLLTFAILNSGISTLNWSLSEDKPWLTVTPTNGSTTTEQDVVTVTVSREGLAYGNYLADISATSNGGNDEVGVTMAVQNPNAPQLSCYPLELNFGTSYTVQNFYITNTGTGTLTWSISDNQDWISISPASGSTTTEKDKITVTVDRTGLSPNDYTGTVSVSSNGGNQDITIKMTVPTEPTLSYSPDSLNFGTGTTALTFNIWNSGSGTLSWSLSDNQDWITANPTSGENSATINVTVDRTGLSQGNYSGEVEIVSNGGTGGVDISMEVYDAPPTPVTLADPMNVEPHQMTLAWSKNEDSDFACYKLYRDTNPGVTLSDHLVTTITDRDTKNHTDTGLSENTTYYYKVFAFDNGGLSSGSNEVHATTPVAQRYWGVVQNFSGVTFYDLFFLNESDGWAVGERNGEGVAYHWDGSSWTEDSPPISVAPIQCVFFLSHNDGWAVGDSTVLRYTGVWAVMGSTPVGDSKLKSVWCLDTNDVWIAGSSGQVFHYLGNGSWNTLNLSAGDLADLHFLNASDGWVLEYNGKIFHWNGVAWALNYNIEGGSCFSIDFLNSTNGWLTRSHHQHALGWVYHYNGINWSEEFYHDFGSSKYPFYSIEMVSLSDGWVVGWSGWIYHYDGSDWSSITSSTSSTLRAVYMLSNIDGWAVGEGGVILRYH